MSHGLDTRKLEEFLIEAGQRLKGEWLLVGGTLLPAVGLNIRPTVDIDLIGLGKEESAQMLELMEISENLNLPVETINQAAGFFLKKIGFKRSDLFILHKGTRSTIYRPSVRLYWHLKMGRLTETDLMDCQHYYNYCLGVKDSVDKTELKKLISEMSSVATSETKSRLQLLESLLSNRRLSRTTKK
jgi:hypothetical protein